MSYTIEIKNRSGHAGRVYSFLSAKSTITGAGNNADTTKSVTWFRSRKLDNGGTATFNFDNSYYGFMGSSGSATLAVGSTVNVQTEKKVTLGTTDGILGLNEDCVFSVIPPDDENPVPGKNQFSIAASARLQPDNDVVGVSRGIDLGEGITPAPINCVPLQAGPTYTIVINNAVYVKTATLNKQSIQASLDDDKTAFKVEFPYGKKKATVVEDINGKFSVTYSRGGDN
ncbi:unnamed protein product [Clonostachys rosea f. rosea IK726]|jgi:hypothetical protein|uniref:Uncharacterized protein n=1 Tax=Clonostachys rosea f. rosea IK726 TaxID=1349383 RepID=A0ACA9TPY7_BIOOC|nr:unnamed protein product [Clonostachys rosea f. rosea IK726]